MLATVSTGLLLFAGGPEALEVRPEQSNRVSIASDRLLQLVKHRVAPGFPAASLRTRTQGVVVAEVLVGEDGRVRTVDFLQSPDATIAESARQALMQWRFGGMMAPGGEKAIIRSKVILYFTIQSGKGEVLDPREMAARRQGRETAAVREDPPRAYRVIDEAEWRRMTRANAVLLDVRHRDRFARGHLDDALNIPESELRTRAPAELSRRTPLVLDCPPDAASLCPYAVKILQDTGFTNVTVLKRS